ncbi:hypothetical protein [Clostridium sp.]
MNVKLLKNISWLITMDNEDNIFEHMDLLIENNRITKIEKI